MENVFDCRKGGYLEISARYVNLHVWLPPMRLTRQTFEMQSIETPEYSIILLGRDYKPSNIVNQADPIDTDLMILFDEDGQELILNVNKGITKISIDSVLLDAAVGLFETTVELRSYSPPMTKSDMIKKEMLK